MPSETTGRGDVPEHLPRAVPLARRGFPWPWIVPLAALVLALVLAREAFSRRGPHLRIVARDGYGLKVGDAMRHKGIVVGEVRGVELAPNLDGVWIDVELDDLARGLARGGSRFWIVRPHLALDEVSGLETVVGARYLATLPGPEGAPFQRQFVALDEAPVVGELEPSGLEVQLESPERHGIVAGAPIIYRGIRVGTVLSVGLASDASQVDMRAYVGPEYAALVRANSRFWEWGGLEVGVGWTGGFRLEMESLRSLLVGGIAFATPDEPGPEVNTGHRFALHSKPEEDWLRWKPRLPVGSVLLPADATLPEPLRVTHRWKGGLLALGRQRSRSAWGLVVEDGFVAPADVIGGAEKSEEDRGGTIELAGASIPPSPPLAAANGLARIAFAEASQVTWPRNRIRGFKAGEHLLVCADPATAAVPVDGAHVAPDGALDASLSFDVEWNGAAVVARSDGDLVGLLVVGEDGARVVAVP